MATADRPENVQAGVATPGFLAMLGYGHPLALGRSFIEDEGTVGRDKVVILTYRVWRDRATVAGRKPRARARRLRARRRAVWLRAGAASGPRQPDRHDQGRRAGFDPIVALRRE